MLTLDAQTSLLLLIDFQSRLTPAIDQGAAALANARRLIAAAAILDLPILFTEQNAKGLGATVPELAPDPSNVVNKMTFDAIRAPGVLERLGGGSTIVMAGCEAHVCVLQTALGLIEKGRRTFVVSDAVGSRRAENKEAAIHRLGSHGVEIVTTEMVLFEWLGTAEHPRFREVVALIK
jgi:nicotinamidase-related amidase